MYDGDSPTPTYPFAATYSEFAAAAWLTTKAPLLPTVRPPNNFDVAVVEVAVKYPNVGEEVAAKFPADVQ